MSDFQPQLLAATDDYAAAEPSFPSEGWIMEPKLDGWRIVFHVIDGSAIPYGRDGKEMQYRIPASLQEEFVARFPDDSIVDTEVVVAGNGKQSTDVSTVLADHTKGLLNAWVFDTMRMAGIDTRRLPWSQRRWCIEQVLHVRFPGSLLHLTVVAEPDVELYKHWTDEVGLEGAVLKRADSQYRSGARNDDWRKYKLQRTMDCRIVGFAPGEGSFKGLVGAIQFEIAPDQVGQASGMTMAVRTHMTENPDSYLGRIVEIGYQGLTTSGYPRHPQYKRMREDLDG